MIGYQRVVDLARQMGLGSNIQPTPAVALGAYEMTPIEVAAGYTAFAAGGVRAEPLFIRSVVSAGRQRRRISRADHASGPRSARRVPDDQPDGGRDQSRHRLSRPAAGIRRRPPREKPARRAMAGSRDTPRTCSASFGLASTTIAILGLAGGAAAAPIWGEFMKRAVELPMYRNTQIVRSAGGNRARGCRSAKWRARHAVVSAGSAANTSSPAASRRSIASFTAGRTRKRVRAG